MIQIESVRHGGFSGSQTITGSDDLIKLLIGNLSLIDIKERSHHDPHHVIQESVALDIQHNLLTVLLHLEMVDGAYGVDLFRIAAAERSEIMGSDKMLRSLPDKLRMKGTAVVIGKISCKRILALAVMPRCDTWKSFSSGQGYYGIIDYQISSCLGKL